MNAVYCALKFRIFILYSWIRWCEYVVTPIDIQKWQPYRLDSLDKLLNFKF